MNLREFLSFFQSAVTNIEAYIPVRDDEGNMVHTERVYSGSSRELPEELLCYDFRCVLTVRDNFLSVFIDR